MSDRTYIYIDNGLGLELVDAEGTTVDSSETEVDEDDESEEGG